MRGILVDRVHRVTGGLIECEQGGFRAGRGCVDQIFALKQIGEKSREKKRRVYVGFIDLEKAYDMVNREALWQVLRMYDVEGKVLNGIKSRHVDSSACVRIKGGISEQFRIDSRVRQGCIISPGLFNVYSPPACHFSNAFCPICTRFVQNKPKIFKFRDIL